MYDTHGRDKKYIDTVVGRDRVRHAAVCVGVVL